MISENHIGTMDVAARTPRGEPRDPVMARDRRRMIAAIESDVKKLRRLLQRPSLDPRVMAAMERVPRHEFVPARQRAVAYENRALAIGHGQTISQPFIVALMTDLLSLEMPAKVLEVGTGSGYQAAVLAELGAEVYSVEVVAELAVHAQHRLARLGYRNVKVRVADGHRGWPEQGPYDGIVVTAASLRVPPELVTQLKPGARLVIPIGARFETQWLTVVEKDQSGQTTSSSILAVAFVPLVGDDRSNKERLNWPWTKGA